MKLSALTEGVAYTLVQGSMDTEITDIVYDSRKAGPGTLFVCIVGTQRDSHDFAADCAAKGAGHRPGRDGGGDGPEGGQQPSRHGPDERQPVR